MITGVGDRWRARLAALGHPVVALGLGLVAVQTILRAWALYPSWFYTDDYRLLYDATNSELSLDYLLSPFDSQFMPVGRLIAWGVADSGHLNWAAAATVTLLLQVAASLAFLWMLTRLFGPRWAILAPLGLYLTSALTMPAYMWWAASLSQLPLQVVLPLAVGTWVSYLRSRSIGWLAACLCVVCVGLLAYVKTILLLPVLAYLMLALFCTGSPLRRLRQAVRDYWPAGVAFAALGVAFTAYYVSQVPSVLSTDHDLPVVDLAWNMLGKSLVTGMLGGPLVWELFNPPVAIVDPPVLVIVVCWVFVAAVATYLWSTRSRTGRVWCLVAAYAVGAYAVLLTTRAGIIGGVAGTEPRYLTDVVPILALGLGLATMELIGAPEGTTERDHPRIAWSPALGAGTTASIIVIVCAAGVYSSATYVDGWHHDNPGAAYFENASSELGRLDSPTLAAQSVPMGVMPGTLFPSNSTERLLPLATSVEFPDVTDRLLVLDSRGHVRRARIEGGPRSVAGPDTGCGYRIESDAPRTIPLTAATPDWEWWVRIGYLSSATTPVQVSAADDAVSTTLQTGLNSLYLKLKGSYDSITIGGLTEGTALCVDTIEVGTPVPGGAL